MRSGDWSGGSRIAACTKFAFRSPRWQGRSGIFTVLAPVGRRVQAPQFLQPLANPRLESAFRRLVPAPRLHSVGKIVLTRRERALLVVRVAIVLAVSEVLHQLRGRVAQSQWHRTRAILLDE